MIAIEALRNYFSKDEVYVTQHAANRYRERGITPSDIRMAVDNGEIIEQYPQTLLWEKEA